ncbi:hypothetical protein HEK131_23330 [Streptomyces seoulensis]|nr:hypothetical protein HEK131_23330 [Streptomyces seoulensis]
MVSADPDTASGRAAPHIPPAEPKRAERGTADRCISAPVSVLAELRAARPTGRRAADEPQVRAYGGELTGARKRHCPPERVSGE